MEAEPHFFLLLPSNASLEIYSDNTLTSFTVHLPEPIVLEGDYEVGLQSIIWPRTINTISESSKRLFYTLSSGRSDAVVISEGKYDTMSSLIDHMNTQLKSAVSDNIQIKFNPISEKVFVTVKNGHQLIVENKLSHILGFGGERKVSANSQESPFVTDLSGGLECLYIYSNIVSYQIVDDTKARLLKVIPIEGKHGEMVYRSFDVPTYYPIGTKDFQDVSIDLRTSAGNKIPFSHGRIVVNLHFRRKSYLP